LVKRHLYDTYPARVTYTLTAHSQTLHDVIDSLRNWGELHRKKMISDDK
jgi:DNA-binding HxlR family transcriptional regulator